MTVSFDRGVIRSYAQALYSKARLTVFMWTLGGGLLFGFVGFVFGAAVAATLGLVMSLGGGLEDVGGALVVLVAIATVFGFIVGGLIGFMIGRTMA